MQIIELTTTIICSSLFYNVANILPAVRETRAPGVCHRDLSINGFK